MNTSSPSTTRVVVDLVPRRTVVFRAMLAGLLGGFAIAVLSVTGVLDTVAIGTSLPLSFGATGQPFFWHFVFSALFGGVFGLLIDSRPYWRYALGFLGPVVGVLFGLAVWGTSNVVLEPLWLLVVGVGTGPQIPFVSEVALVGYLCYGVLVGTAVNLVV